MREIEREKERKRERMDPRNRTDRGSEGDIDGSPPSSNRRLVAFLERLDRVEVDVCSMDFSDRQSTTVKPLMGKLREKESPDYRDFIAMGADIYMVDIGRFPGDPTATGKNVFIYHTLSGVTSRGPSLIASKPYLLLAAVSANIFAFPTSLSRAYSDPRFEVLDTAGSRPIRWVPVPDPELSSLFPKDPKPSVITVQCFAASPTTLFISYSGVCSFAYNVTSKKGVWKFSKQRFPFVGEAMFVDDLFFGIPQASEKRGFLCSYRICKADLDDFYFEEIGLFPLAEPPLTYRHFRDPDYTIRPLLLPLSRNHIFVFRHYVDKPMNYWPPIHKHHGILVEAYKLEHGKSKRTKEGPKETSISLSWHKLYRVKGAVCKWLFI